jgi:predicted small secreted protein
MKHTVVFLAALLMLSACETFQGLGRDMQAGGSHIEDFAKSVTP